MDACLRGVFFQSGLTGLGLRLGFPATWGMKVAVKKLESLLAGENRMILRLLVLTYYQRVTNRQTDTPPVVERDKKLAVAML